MSSRYHRVSAVEDCDWNHHSEKILTLSSFPEVEKDPDLEIYLVYRSRHLKQRRAETAE